MRDEFVDTCGLCDAPLRMGQRCACGDNWRAAQPAPAQPASAEQQPVAYLYQHDETARTTLRTADDRMTDEHVRNGRWSEMPLYFAAPPALHEAVNAVLRCRYPVCTSIDPSGYGWDIPRLNEVIDALRAALDAARRDGGEG